MAFGSMGRSVNQVPMAEINVVPLVDVMLVLFGNFHYYYTVAYTFSQGRLTKSIK